MEDQEGVAPPGWEPSIRRMKRLGTVDNPWALAWWMQRHGMTPHRDSMESEERFDADVRASLQMFTTRPLPSVCVAAARGEPWAHTVLLTASTPPLMMEQGK